MFDDYHEANRTGTITCVTWDKWLYRGEYRFTMEFPPCPDTSHPRRCRTETRFTRRDIVDKD